MSLNTALTILTAVTYGAIPVSIALGILTLMEWQSRLDKNKYGVISLFCFIGTIVSLAAFIFTSTLIK